MAAERAIFENSQIADHRKNNAIAAFLEKHVSYKEIRPTCYECIKDDCRAIKLSNKTTLNENIIGVYAMGAFVFWCC